MARSAASISSRCCRRASARARRREHASAYLREIGLKSATVVIDQGGRKSIWRVPELGIDLDHKRSRSQIAGRAKIESLAGPFTLNFRTYEHEATKTLQLAVSVQGLVPRGLARTLPPLAGLESLDVPVWGDARLDLSNTGEILSGTISIDAAPGQVLLPWLTATPLRIDGGHLSLSYSRAARRFDVAPSVLVWGDSRMQFTGSIVHTQQGPDGPGWAFELKSAGGWLGAEPPLLQRLAIDDWSARGFASPERGRVVLSQFQLRAGGAEVSAEGDVTDMAGAMKARLDGKIGSMPVSIFKTLWPAPLAPRTRDWVVKRLVRGWLQGGSFRLATDAGPTGSGWAATPTPERASLTLEGANLAFNIVDSWPVLEMPRALLRLDEATLEMRVPDASFAVADGRRLGLKGTFTVDMKEPLPRTGRIAFRGQGPLSVALEMLDGEPFQLLQKNGLNPAGIEGKVDGQLAVAMPLGQALEPRDLKIEGKTRISDARIGQLLGPYEVHGANVTLDMTPTAAEARGEMLINGVVAKASWQHVFGAPADKQPPMRITTVLDNSYRNQLGLDINDLVQGDVGVEVTVGRDARGERRVHLRADLLNAEVLLDSVAWRKPKGKPSVFEFDVVKGGNTHPTELMNVRLVGDDVAIEGWMGIGADNKVKEFRFPNFSLNVVTSLETYGKVRPDGIWEVTAKGPTYDGRDLFRAFFDVSQFDQGAKVRAGPRPARRGGHGGGLLRHDAAQGEDDAAEAGQQAHQPRRAGHPGGRQAVCRDPPAGTRPAAPAARRVARCRPAVQARRLLPQRRRRIDDPRRQSRRQRAGGAGRHAVGARLSRPGRSHHQRGAAERRRQPAGQRAPHGRARAVRVRDHARALRGRPRPVRDARGRHQGRARQRAHERQGRLPPAGAGYRRDLRADVGPDAGPGRDTDFRAAAHRPARRGSLRHHLRHQGLDGAPAGDRQPAVADHARHLPRSLPDDPGGPPHHPARAAGSAPQGRLARLQRAGGDPARRRIGGAGGDAGGGRQLVGRGEPATPAEAALAPARRPCPQSIVTGGVRVG